MRSFVIALVLVFAVFTLVGALEQSSGRSDQTVEAATPAPSLGP